MCIPSHFFHHQLTSSRKKAVSSQTSELEALEARLKATEERLKAAAANAPGGRSGRSSPRPRQPLGDTFSPPKDAPTSPLSTEFQPSSARSNVQNDVASKESYQGVLPPTPGASEGESEPEYVVVRGADKGKDGDVTEASRVKAA